MIVVSTRQFADFIAGARVTLGILAAIHDEIADLLDEMGKSGMVVEGADTGLFRSAGSAVCKRIGMRDYHTGEIYGQPCVIVLARIGKVAAAATTVTLIREFGVSEIIFTGLAGSAAAEVNIGDLVIADRLVQHDLDARPLFPQHEVPLLGMAAFPAAGALSAELCDATRRFLSDDLPVAVKPEILTEFGIAAPRLHVGMIASGDQFIADPSHAQRIRAALPAAIAVEMEGAAVAQICHEYDIPFAVVRTISDRADNSAHVDFGKFLATVASHYSNGILRRFLLRRAAGDA